MDVPNLVAKTIYEREDGNEWEDLDDSKKKKKESRVKKLLNTQAVERMTIERIEQRNGLEEIILWLNTIRDIE